MTTLVREPRRTEGYWKILLLTAFPQQMVSVIRREFEDFLFVGRASTVVTAELVRRFEIDLVVCFGYPLIISSDVLCVTDAINLHGSLLPAGRGPNPNLWSVVDETPRGATIHYIDGGIDSGDIIAQRKSSQLPKETTFEAAFDESVETCLRLFGDQWPAIRAGNVTRTPQGPGGSLHRLRDQAPLEPLLTAKGLSLPISEFRRRARELLLGHTRASQG